MRTLAALLGAAAIAGACSLAPPAAPPTLYDLGPLPAGAAQSLVTAAPRIGAVDAPQWLDSPGIVYRLSYDEPTRRAVYRDSRWVAPPAALLAQRLKQWAAALAPTGPLGDADPRPPQLSLELDEFEQVFTSPTSCQVRVSLRAVLGRPGDPHAARRVFTVSRDVADANALGAVRGLGAASDEVLVQVLRWAAAP